MQIYTVGGAVRDTLLGLPVKDRDYVVVGATPEQMLKLGYTPVGKDFPVFLHPKTHAEHALARTERKTAPGYKGFVFHTDEHVTLEEDLIRRDLTINAMAQDESGHIVDPFGGQRDLQARVFRHVSQAFAEDPVRILRLARFAARFTDFTVAEETNALMWQMVQAGEVDALVPERVWQEISRGLMEAKPSRMFEVLRGCGALARMLPELDALWQEGGAQAGLQTMTALDYSAQCGQPLQVRFAVLAYQVKAVDVLCQRLKVPNECRDLARLTAREYPVIAFQLAPQASQAVLVLERCDAFRKTQRFGDLLASVACLVGAAVVQAYPQFCTYWEAALKAAQGIDSGAIAASVDQPSQIPQAIHAARVRAVAGAMQAG